MFFERLKRRKNLILFFVICSAFAISNAQNMFFHLLPGFVPAFTWVGLGGDANWNNPANWSTGVVPGASDTANFNDICVSNCDPTMNVAINVSGINMGSSYLGTITQGVGQSVTIGSAGWTQQGGVFLGAGANVNMNGFFVLGGGTFTATSGLTTYSNHFTKSGGTYSANSGQTTFNGNQTITPDNVQLTDVNFAGMVTHNLAGGTLIVNGNLTLDSPSPCCNAAIDNGTIQVKGNVDLNNYSKVGSAIISLAGTGNQTLTGGAVGRMPGLQINSSGGVVSFINTITVYGNYAYLAGVVDASVSTLVFAASAAQTVIPGNVQYNHVSFSSMGAQELSGGTMTVLGTLTFSRPNACCDSGVNNGTIHAKGNIDLLDYGRRGTANVVLSGVGNQNLTGLTNTSVPNVEINSTGGTVTVTGQIFPSGNWIFTSGVVSLSGSTLIFNQTNSIVPGPLNYDNVTFGGQVSQTLNGGTMNVSGTLIFESPNACCGASVDNGSINAGGNVSFNLYGKSGTTLLNFTGISSATLTIAATAATLSTTHNVFKTGAGKVSLVAPTNYSAAGRNFSVTSGTLDLAGFNFTVNNALTISINGILLCNGGTATASTWTVSGQISCGTGQGITWTGATGDNLWSTAGNWTNNTIPGASDIAIFNNAVCVGLNCNAQINSNLSIRGMTLQATYPGILNQNSSRTLTIGTGGFFQSGGTFTGGDAAVTMNGAFNLSGGTYTATSGLWTQSANMTISGAPVFNHNSGSWTTSSTITIVPNGINLNNTSFAACGLSQNLSGGTIIVSGTLTLSSQNCAVGTVNNGIIEARGDVVSVSQGRYGTASIKINGTGAQNLNGASGTNSRFLAIEVDKSSGTLTLLNTILVYGNWIVTNGTVDAGTSDLRFKDSGNIVPANVDYYRIHFAGCGDSFNLGGGTIKVLDSLTFDGEGCVTAGVNNGTIDSRGDISISYGGKNGTAVLVIDGTGSQTITGNNLGTLPPTTINKVSGTLFLVNTIFLSGNWTYVSGVIDVGTSTLYFNGTATITPGPIEYYGITLAGCGISYNLNNETLIVNGPFTVHGNSCGVGQINSGNILIRSDMTIVSTGKLGSAVLKIDGTGSQTLTGSVNGAVSNLTIEKSAGTLTLASTIFITGNYTYTSGIIDAGTSVLTLNGTSASIIPGNVEYNDVTFSGCGSIQNLNAGTMIINGTLTFHGNSCGAGSLNNGTIDLRGHLSVVSTGRSGNAIINYTGASTKNFNWSGGSFLNSSQTIAKTGGASILLNANATFSGGQIVNVTSGFLDLNAFDLNVNSTLNVSVGATVKCSGGTLTTSVLNNSGTVNCPGFSTYDFNWTGASADSNWATAANWSGGVAPGASDLVVFQDTYCGANCSVNINNNSSLRGVHIYSPYTGTITQGSGISLTIGNRGWLQNAGVFLGSDAPITIGGNFTINGGSFTAPNNTMTMNGGSTWTTNLATFNHNNGTVVINLGSGTSTTFNTGANSFNNLNLFTWAGSYTVSGTSIVNGHLQFGSASGSGTNFSGGTVTALGDVTSLSNGTGSGTATTVINIAGTGLQNITGSGNWPSMTINKASGTANLFGNYQFNGVLNYTSGTINPGLATFNFNRANGTTTHQFNGLTLTNVSFNHIASSAVFNLSNQALNVTGTLTFNALFAAAAINSGTINAYGDIIQIGTASIGGTANLNILGTTNTTITAAGTISIPGATVTVNKNPINRVTLVGNSFLNNAGQNLTIVSGTLDMNSYNLTVGNNISNGGTLKRGNNPTCGTVSQAGVYTGNAPICP
jgi:hypothetical protein